MTQERIARIDRILDSVRERESGLTVAQLGLVERVRYDEKQNKLIVFTKAVHSTHGCCTLLALVQQSAILAELEAAFKNEFPEHWVQVLTV